MPNCDLHKSKGVDVEATYDSKTVMGPHAYLCDNCMTLYGCAPTTRLRKPQPERTDISYDEWFDRVEEKLEDICGMGTDDLPDVVNLHDCWEDGDSPMVAANKVIAEAGFF